MGFTVWHNIVYSAKGGCGKTTFSSLFRLLDKKNLNELAKKYKAQRESDDLGQGPLILMDLDLLASNLGDADTEFIKNVETDKNNPKGDNKRALFDYLIKNKAFEYVENYAIKGSNGEEPDKKFMLVNSPTTEEQRGWFKAKRRYVPVVKYDEFRYGLVELLRQVCNKNNYSENGKKPDKINIVYDLPPNSDGYTEIVFDTLLNKKSEIQKFKNGDEDVTHNFRIFVLSLPDATIMNVNISWLKNFLTESGSNNEIKYKYFIINCYAKTDDEIKAGSCIEFRPEWFEDLSEKKVVFAVYDNDIAKLKDIPDKHNN